VKYEPRDIPQFGLKGLMVHHLTATGCHLSHSVTCHPTQINTPRLSPSQTGQQRRDRRLNWPLRWWFTCQQSPIQVVTMPSVEQPCWLRAKC